MGAGPFTVGMASSTMMEVITFFRPVRVFHDGKATSELWRKYFVVRAWTWDLHVLMDFRVVDEFASLCKASFSAWVVVLMCWYCPVFASGG